MALVQMADIIDVIVFQDLPAVNSPEKTAFMASGIVVRDAILDGLASAAGKTAELPFWNDLDTTNDPNLTTDTTAVATAEKVDQGEQITRKAFLNNGWAKSALASELALGGDVMEHIRSRVDTYWMRQWQRRLLNTCEGVRADNVANDAGDMTHDVAAESIALTTVSTLFSRQNYIDAAYTMGDRVDGIVAIAIHSVIHKQMVEQGEAEDVRDSDGQLMFQAYMGARIIVDDTMTKIAGGTDGFKYVSILFGAGAIGYGDGEPEAPVAVQRDEDQGNGGGVEKLWVRKTWIIHPAGFQNLTTPAAISFSNTELATAALWDRVVDRKNVPMAFLITN